MDRDFATFPKDQNGDALWFAQQKGIEIGAEHTIRFAVIFPQADAALRFGVFLLRQGYWVQVNEIDDKPGFMGEALVDMALDATHQEISGAENWLAEHSASIGGKNDGWQIKAKTPRLVASEFHDFA